MVLFKRTLWLMWEIGLGVAFSVIYILIIWVFYDLSLII